MSEDQPTRLWKFGLFQIWPTKNPPVLRQALFLFLILLIFLLLPADWALLQEGRKPSPIQPLQ
jgi:hypothetical protein